MGSSLWLTKGWWLLDEHLGILGSGNSESNKNYFIKANLHISQRSSYFNLQLFPTSSLFSLRIVGSLHTFHFGVLGLNSLQMFDGCMCEVIENIYWSLPSSLDRCPKTLVISWVIRTLGASFVLFGLWHLPPPAPRHTHTLGPDTGHLKRNLCNFVGDRNAFCSNEATLVGS